MIGDKDLPLKESGAICHCPHAPLPSIMPLTVEYGRPTGRLTVK